MSTSRNAPGTVVDCVYDGHYTIFVHGHVSDEVAAAAAVEYVLAVRKEDAGTWYDFERWTIAASTAPRPEPALWRCVRCRTAFSANYEDIDGYWIRHAPPACPACGADCAEDVPTPRYGVACGPSARSYARWLFASGGSAFARELHIGFARGRGAFPVTLVEDLDDRDRERALEAKRAAEAADAVARVVALWPESTDHRASRRHGDDVDVSFRVPGLAHPASWYTGDPGRVRVTPGDLETWQATYSGRSSRDPGRAKAAEGGGLAGESDDATAVR